MGQKEASEPACINCVLGRCGFAGFSKKKSVSGYRAAPDKWLSIVTSWARLATPPLVFALVTLALGLGLVLVTLAF